MSLCRRDLVLAALAAPVLAPFHALARIADDLELGGRWVQGGFIIGRTRPEAVVLVDGVELTAASSNGSFILGLDRDAPASTQIAVTTPEGGRFLRTVAIAAGTFPSTRVNGLPPSTIAPSDPALLARIRRESALKVAAFASRDLHDDFADGFIWPLESYRVSSAWGAQRVLNGTPARPHYGIDLAAPRGSVIRAPAAGLVVLAEPDLHFEGGLTLIDHGQGLVTAYLHQSALDVREGQRVRQGEPIGRVGATGRATGPHLCWRMKWRDRNLDPSLMVGPDPFRPQFR